MDLSLAGATLLVGIDFSHHCERALRRAVNLAEQKAARLELVHVFDWASPQTPRDIKPALSAKVTYFLWDAVVARVHAARQRLEKIRSTVVENRVPAQTQVLIGEPASELLQAAEQACAPLIVLGARGRRAVQSKALGRTVERVCATSATSVLLVLEPSVAEQPVDVWVPGARLGFPDK